MKENTLKKQSVNHARAKRKIKTLKAKQTVLRIGGGSLAALLAKLKVPPPTVSDLPANEKRKSLLDSSGPLNQRQKRKLWRQAPHMRKKA